MVRSISKNRIIRNLFNKLAVFYDAMENETIGPRSKLWRTRALQVSGLTHPHRVLDGCSGTGQMSIQMAQTFGSNTHIVAVDFSPAMVAQAKQKFRTQHIHRRVEFKTENVEIMPFPDDFFDGAFISFGLRFVSDIRIVLRECMRVLKRRAPLVILELAQPANPLVRMYAHTYREHWLPFWLWQKWRIPKNLIHPLFDSLYCYPDPDKMQRMMTRVGFETARYEKLSAGAVTMHWGIKPGLLEPEKDEKEI